MFDQERQAFVDGGRLATDGVAFSDLSTVKAAVEGGTRWFDAWMQLSDHYEQLATTTERASDVSVGEWLWLSSMTVHAAQLYRFEDEDEKRLAEGSVGTASVKRHDAQAPHQGGREGSRSERTRVRRSWSCVRPGADAPLRLRDWHHLGSAPRQAGARIVRVTQSDDCTRFVSSMPHRFTKQTPGRTKVIWLNVKSDLVHRALAGLGIEATTSNDRQGGS